MIGPDREPVAGPDVAAEVAAVVVTYRRPRLATAVVRGLLEREGLPPDRVILVVNGEGGLDDPALERSIQVVRLAGNLGPAGGFREGMRAAARSGANWIYLCEDDVALFDLPSPRLGALLGDLQGLAPDADGRPVGAVVAYGRDLIPRTGHTVVHDVHDTHHADGDRAFDEVDVASWGASLVSREVVSRGVLPVDDYFFGYEDFDFWYRLRAAGFRLLLDRTTAAHVARHMSLEGRDAAFVGQRPVDADEPWRAFYVARNFFLLARRHGRPSWIAAHFVYSVRRWQLARSGAERAAIVRGLAAGLRGRTGKDPRFARDVGELGRGSEPAAGPGGRRGSEPAAGSQRRAAPLVLHVLPYDLARGGQMIARDLVDELDGEWGEQRILTLFAAPDALLFPDYRLDVPMGRLRAVGLDPRVLLRLRGALRLLRPTIVVAHGGEPLKYLGLAGHIGAPFVYFSFGVVTDEAHSGWRWRLYRWLMHRADVIAGISDECVAEARDLFSVPADRLVLVPNSRDPRAYAPGRRPSETNGAPLTLIFVGHLTTTKRPDRFVEVVAELRRRGHPVRGVMVGDGPMERQIRSVATAAGVDVLGRRIDVASILGEADVFVFPSVRESEGMPGVLIEAGLAGLPVVSTAAPGASTVVIEGETGFIVPIDDRDALVAAVERLVVDDGLRTAMGAAGRTRCVAQFSLDASGRRWSALFDRLVRRDGG